MLIEFSVTNFLSIREKTTLSLVKGTGTELVESNTIESSAPGTPDILVSAAIYGANGAGKTNIVKALRTMKGVVLNSGRESNVGDAIDITPFLLDDVGVAEPSEFELVFVVDDVRYQYGFSATSKRIIDEWLFAYPKGRPQRLIERSYVMETDVYIWGTMNKLIGQKQLWQDATRSNALFLSTAVQLNSEQLRPIFRWIAHYLRVVGLGKWTSGFTIKQCEDEHTKKQIERMLRVADTDIGGIEVEKYDSAMRHMNSRGELEFDLRKPVIKTIHATESGKTVRFDLSTESDGTQKFFQMSGPWLDTLANGYTLIVDELHDNLHSHMVQFLVQLFHDKRINKNGAQLIFTTHDTSLLNQDIFRRDQIWLCEKDEGGSSRFYPMTDFSPRKGVENLERGYLAGRYGALPYIQDLAEALEE